jgi:hypothetical protein
MPLQRFSHVHLDLVGPLPLLPDSFSYILTVVNHTTRWFEADSLWCITATAIADAFIAVWVAGFGIPATIMHSWALPEKSMTSGTGLTSMPECRCRNADAGMPMPECQCRTDLSVLTVKLTMLD